IRSTWKLAAAGPSSRKTHPHRATADCTQSKPIAERPRSRWSEACVSTRRNVITSFEGTMTGSQGDAVLIDKYHLVPLPPNRVCHPCLFGSPEPFSPSDHDN